MGKKGLIIGAIVGVLLGSLLGNPLAACLIGAILGWSIPQLFGNKTEALEALQRELDDQKNHFNREIWQLRERLARLENPPTSQPAATASLSPEPAITVPEASVTDNASAALEAITEEIPEKIVASQPEPVAAKVIHEWQAEEPIRLQRTAPQEPAEPDFFERAFLAAKDWLFGGNTLVRMGIVLVFIGCAFLLRYASDHVVIPVELRYLGISVGALAALVLGWRLRESKPSYALLMQGAAVAVMYLTIFAAMRLHPLIPTSAGFVLLVCVAALSAILAIAQNALSLALAGSLGGFAAPVLASTGGGSHVALFSYFALLNTGILGIAWFKAWRPLNLVGFFGTFLIGMAWGLRSYAPEHYASCQFFLTLFFLMFVGISLLFVRRVLLENPDAPQEIRSREWWDWVRQQGDYADGTLLFGVPIAAFGLQYALVRDFEYGAAFSSLGLGLFYMALARSIFSRSAASLRLLVEIFLALGVVFASLAIPLGLDAQWTSAAWAVEAAGIYWVGHRQGRVLGRAFALLLQAGAVIAWFSQINFDHNTLLSGPVLGTLMLGLAFLANALSLRQARLDQRNTGDWDARWDLFFNTLGLWFLFLLAPLTLKAQACATTWALTGLLTAYLGLRLQARGWVGNALLVQLLAGIVFLLDMRHNFSLLGSGGLSWHGLTIASLLGIAALVSTYLAIREARALRDPVFERRMAWVMLFGLSFMALAVLFVLPWAVAAGVWAACGVLILALALWLALQPAFWFALLLEIAAGLTYLVTHLPRLFLTPLADAHLAAFAHSAFWTPAIIAIAAFLVAWRLVVHTRQTEQDDTLLAWPALIWSAGWWALAWGAELARLLPSPASSHVFLAIMALTTLLWNRVAARSQWSHPVTLGGGLLLPLAALLAFNDYAHDAHLLGAWGWLGFGLVALNHGLQLRLIDLLPVTWSRIWQRIGVWVGLFVLSLEIRHLFILLAEPDSAWRWLGWTLPLIAWLLACARRPWPNLYRFGATLPVMVLLAIWSGVSALQSAGNPNPLPFIPILNPLELAQILVLFACLSWVQAFADQDEDDVTTVARLLGLGLYGLGFIVYTMLVLRALHHLGGIAWQSQALLNSMAVQASLSLAWSLLALGLMIAGHRLERRIVWIVGATLVAVVVAKLFLIELSNQGGLERIISFMGVGILLLIVGYFAPLPPAKPEDESV